MQTIKQSFTFSNALEFAQAMGLVVVETFRDGYAMQSKVDRYY